MEEPSTPSTVNTVLSIDPGTAKCGIAVVCRRTGALAVSLEHVLHREVVETERLVSRVLALLAQFDSIEALIIGNATRGAVLRRALVAAIPDQFPVHSVEEAFTSQRARARFQIENPPSGWQRLVPIGLRNPPRAYDDYVAILLAEDFFGMNASPA